MSKGKLDQIVYSNIVTWYGFYQKVSDEIREAVHAWIFNHPHIICYSDKQDTLLVPNPDDISGEKMRVGKWLIQIPITKLHQDLLSTGDLGFKFCLNDTVLVRNVVLSNVVVSIISPENMPPVGADSGTAITLAVMRISDESQSFIFDEIYRRSFIEYDPNQVIDVVEVVNEVEAIISDESSNGENLSDSDNEDDDDA